MLNQIQTISLYIMYIYIFIVCGLTFLVIKLIEYVKEGKLEGKTKLYAYLIVIGTIFWGLIYDYIKSDNDNSILNRVYDTEILKIIKDIFLMNLLGVLFMAGFSMVLITVFHFFKGRLANIYNLSDDLIDSDFFTIIFFISNTIMSVFFFLFIYVFGT